MLLENIESRLNRILQKRAQIDFKTNPQLRDERLLGAEIGMPARELILVFFDVEKEFGIKIPEQAIIDCRFDTFNHIAKIIKGDQS